MVYIINLINENNQSSMVYSVCQTTKLSRLCKKHTRYPIYESLSLFLSANSLIPNPYVNLETTSCFPQLSLFVNGVRRLQKQDRSKKLLKLKAATGSLPIHHVKPCYYSLYYELRLPRTFFASLKVLSGMKFLITSLNY